MGDERLGTSLSRVQAAMYDLITAPEGVAGRLHELGISSVGLASMVKPSASMSAIERVDVYANMYFYRILDVLRDEYSRVAVAVGDVPFHNLITEYLIACRPAHPSLREVGARLPTFVAHHALAEERPWLVELARLERMHLDLYDGPDAAALTMDDVRGQSSDAFAGLFLRAVPCHAVLRSRFTLSNSWKGLGAGHSPGTIREAPETLLVWRQGVDVFHRVVDRDEEPLLPLLETGTRFDAVCEQVLAHLPEEQAAHRAFEILGRWVNEGLIATSAQG